MSDSLLDKLIELETALHKQSTRNDRSRLEELLHGDFFEFGSSGKVWSRQETIESLSQETQDAVVTAEHFKLHKHAEEVAQLTYVSQRNDGSKTLRSSLWKLDKGQWRMIFHQGTKTQK